MRDEAQGPRLYDLDDRVDSERVEHLDAAAADIIDVSRDQNKSMHPRGRRECPVSLVLVLGTEQARPFRRDSAVNRHEPCLVGALERVQFGQPRRREIRGGFLPAFLPSPLLEERHDADPQIGLGDGSVPGAYRGIALGVKFAKYVLIKQVNRHVLEDGCIGSSSFSMSHTPDSAMPASIFLKLRVGSGRPGFG